MFQTSRNPAVYVLLIVLQLPPLSACSALIDVSGQQCGSDIECRAKRLGDLCIEHVCVDSPDQSSPGVQSSGQDSVQRNPRCVKDTDCSGSTPRCMRNTCVSQEVAELFLCRAPEAPPVNAGDVQYSFKVIEYRSRKPPKDLTAQACRAADVMCVDAISPARIDSATGLVEFTLPRGFLGFFDVQSDAMPALSYLTKPILVDTVDRDLQVSSPATFQGFAMLDGVDLMEGKGIALLEAFDCTGTPVGGVHFEASSSSAQPFYIVNHVPNHDIKVSALDPDMNVADGGFVNIEPGFVSFTARYGVDGPELGTFNVAVRPDTFTFVDMYF